MEINETRNDSLLPRLIIGCLETANDRGVTICCDFNNSFELKILISF